MSKISLEDQRDIDQLLEFIEGDKKDEEGKKKRKKRKKRSDIGTNSGEESFETISVIKRDPVDKNIFPTRKIKIESEIIIATEEESVVDKSVDLKSNCKNDNYTNISEERDIHCIHEKN